MPSLMCAKLDPAKLADVQTVANKLADLPKDALLYVSGYVAGRWDATESNNRMCADEGENST